MRFLLTIVMLLAALRPALAHAADACAAPAAEAAPFAAPVTEGEITRRLTLIETTLEERDSYAKWWKYGWMTVFGVGAVGQLAIGLTTDDQKVENDAFVGAATALLGVSGMVISRVDAGGNLRTLREYPAAPTAPLAARLQCAEYLLKDTRDGEVYGRGWQEYALSALVSGSAGAIMWLYYDQPESFWLKTGSGVVFSVARIQTTPRAATRAWEAYQAGGVLTPGLAGRGGREGADIVLTPSSAHLVYRF